MLGRFLGVSTIVSNFEFEGLQKLQNSYLVSVSDVSSAFALVEVQGLGDVEWSLLIVFGSVALLLQDRVDSFAFAFQSDFGDGENLGVFLILLGHAALHLQSLDIVAFQVQLEHVQDGTLDVLGPSAVILKKRKKLVNLACSYLVEVDSLDDTVNIANTQWLFKNLLQLSRNFFALKVFQWLDTLSFWQFRVQFSKTDVLELEFEVTFVGEGQIGIGTQTGSSGLLDLWKGLKNCATKKIA